MTNSERVQMFHEKELKRLSTGKKSKDGRLSARERISVLFDDGKYTELGGYEIHHCNNFGLSEKKVAGDGVICAFGHINGVLSFAYSQDGTAMGGSLGAVHANKICSTIEKAISAGAPVIGMLDSGGARIQEGPEALDGYGRVFRAISKASGVIPQISIIFGKCAGGAVYSSALTDFVFMVEGNGQMYITGPAVVSSVTGESVSDEELGGSYMHTYQSGVVHCSKPTEEECIESVKKLITYTVPELECRCDCDTEQDFSDRIIKILPEENYMVYDMKDVIDCITDKGSFFEIHRDWADNIIVGFARINGKRVGIIANQPIILGGCIDVSASDKAARFVQCCDAFGIPLVTLVDTPGYLPGTDQESQGIIRHGAKMLYTYSVSDVPKITVVIRKAYGGSYIAMCPKSLGADYVFAWPSADIAVMGAEGAANVVFKKRIVSAENTENERQKCIKEYSDLFSGPYIAAESGLIDKVIEPSETKNAIYQVLSMLSVKKDSSKIKGNMPF